MNSALNELLKQASRSFWLTLRVLAGGGAPANRPRRTCSRAPRIRSRTRKSCRSANGSRRCSNCASGFSAQSSAPLNFGVFAQSQGRAEGKVLPLEKVEDALAALKEFSDADQKLIREVLATNYGYAARNWIYAVFPTRRRRKL
jgi:hypothetical protein